MPAPTFRPPVYGTAPDQFTTVEAWEQHADALSVDLWSQMHALLGRSVVGTIATSGSAEAIAVRVASAYAEVPREGGATFAIRPLYDNAGPDVTLSVELDAPYPVRDANGDPLVKGALRAGEWSLVRQSGTAPDWEYWLITSESDLWAQVARGDILPTVNVTGGPNDVRFRIPSAIAARVSWGLGTSYLIRMPAANTGAMRLAAEDEALRELLDPDGLPCVAGEVQAGRLYWVRDSGTEAARHYRIMNSVVTRRDLNAFWAAIAAAESGGSGGGGEVDERAEIGVWLDGTVIRAAGDDAGVVADLGDWPVLEAPRGGRFAAVTVDHPEWGPRLLGGYPGHGLLCSAAPQVLELVPIVGQSLAAGAQAAGSLVTLAQDWPADALMFAGDGVDVRMGLETASVAEVLDPATLTGFQALTARVGAGAGERGETIAEGFARRLTRLARRMNIQRRMLLFSVGVGGTAYSGLKKGTQAHANLLAAVTRAKALAAAQGWRVEVPGVLCKHGEADQTNSAYAAALAEWQADLDVDLRAITGQSASVHMFVGQPSSFVAGTESVRGMVAAVSPTIHLVGPDYGFRDAYAEDLLHFTGPGYELIGEAFALAWRDAFWRPDGAQAPVGIFGGVRTGTAVSLSYYVPDAPLAIDAADDPGQWGFRFFDGPTEIPITGATVTNTGASGVGSIQLILASAPAGDGRVEYALRLQSDPRTPARVPRGCVRDSAPEVSQYDGRRLYRWAIHQSVTIGAPSGSGGALPAGLPAALGG